MPSTPSARSAVSNAASHSLDSNLRFASTIDAWFKSKPSIMVQPSSANASATVPSWHPTSSSDRPFARSKAQPSPCSRSSGRPATILLGSLASTILFRYSSPVLSLRGACLSFFQMLFNASTSLNRCEPPSNDQQLSEIFRSRNARFCGQQRLCYSLSIHRGEPLWRTHFRTHAEIARGWRLVLKRGRGDQG